MLGCPIAIPKLNITKLLTAWKLLSTPGNMLHLKPSPFWLMTIQLSSCSGKKLWNHPWHPCFSHTLTFKLSVNPIGPTFKIYTEFNYFSPPPLPSPWNEPIGNPLAKVASQRSPVSWNRPKRNRLISVILQVLFLSRNNLSKRCLGWM